MARPLGLKSKSVGRGETRRPVLYRTKATPKFHPATLTVAKRVANRFLGEKHKMKIGTIPKNRNALGRYKDGDIVGNGLPEIGTENRGRAMLEKMGWSTGMALGSHNKGILQPVPQVVKRTKAGLGQ